MIERTAAALRTSTGPPAPKVIPADEERSLPPAPHDHRERFGLSRRWCFLTEAVVPASGHELWRELSDLESLGRWHPFVSGAGAARVCLPGRLGSRLRLRVREARVEAPRRFVVVARRGPAVSGLRFHHEIVAVSHGSFHATVVVATSVRGPLRVLARRRRCARLHDSIVARLLRRAERRRVLESRGWSRSAAVRLVARAESAPATVRPAG